MSPLLVSFALGGLFYALCDVFAFRGPLPRGGATVLAAATAIHAALLFGGSLPILPAPLERFLGILAGEALYYFLTLPARRPDAAPASLFSFFFLAAAFAAIFSLPTAWGAGAPGRLAPFGALALLFAWNFGALTALLGEERPRSRVFLSLLLAPLEAAALR